MIQKSYNNTPTLYVVPTPIGNMDDITLRAIDVLKDVNYILSEDTRVAKMLLNNLDIRNKKLISCHKFNELQVCSEIIQILQNGNNIAIVTDRGTPLISDPGYVVVRNVIDYGFNVVALPGASAVLPALNMSGICADKFFFYGFLSNKESESIKELEMLSSINFTIVLYESPHRLLKTLRNIRQVLGNNFISISREISKIYEEVFRGTVDEAIEYYKDPKGEMVIVINNNIHIDNTEVAYSDLIELLKCDINNKDALKYISKKYNVSKNLLYNMYEERKK